MIKDRNYTCVKTLRGVLVAAMTLLTSGSAMADGVVVKGNVYGGGNLADVKTNTEVNMSTGTVEGNVYGGGNLGDVGTHADQDPVSVGNYDWKDQDGNTITNTTAAAKMTGVSKVTITGGTVGVENSAKPKEQGNVFGGGKGAATTFECEKGMVYKTSVSIQKNGTTNTLVYRNVYGGGEVSRVENDTEVTIGTASGTDEPNIKGSVFAAGAGVETHGYSALVRGHSTVTVQGKATVEHNVYGGGELASVGRYKVKTPANASDTDVPATLPYGMPAHLIDGGKNTVTITDNAVIGTEGDNTTGHVYGAGKGLDPYETTYTYKDDANKPKRMVSGNTWEHFADVAAYLQFVETLALSAATDVDISESATVKGSVFGGSESGFVYHNTDVEISGGTVNGDAFGGGRGLSTFAEAGRVRGNTNLAVSGGAVEGNVYGGGNLGDVGTINKSDASYNYVWKNSTANGNAEDTGNNNTSGNNTITGTNTNTGICTVTISGGTIGVDTPDDATRHGNVFGAGEGLDDTWWCEKATAFATHVTITDGTVKGNVYGGGQIGRVEDDAKVTIGNASDTGSESKPNITGSVFGAGAGLATHGYSALVRGNTEVTVEGIAQVGGNVYGGGEIASVGRFHVVGGLPKNPQAGGICTVKIQGSAKVGTSGTDHNVFGACKGVEPAYNNTVDNANRSKSMQLYTNRPNDTSLWSHYNNDENSPFIWRYYASEADYLDFLQTLALTSNTDVTIAESASVYGSVFGGGERGVTLGGVDVNMVGGTVKKDVYGGGSLADSNRAMRDNDDALHDYVELELIEGLSVVTGYYTSKSDDALITTADAKAVSGTTYYAKYKTNVNLTGGVVEGDAYGGGLGIHDIGEVGQTGYVAGTPAYVYGNVTVKLNEGVENDAKGCVVSRVFGCNNLKGTPKGHVLVHVYATQNVNKENISSKNPLHDGAEEVGATSTYDVAAVYGGGNLAPYEPAGGTGTQESTEVIIDGCQLTSIKQVYGGGNAAPAPATLVRVNGTYEIEEVFGGGNGKDDYVVNNKYYKNPGANVGYYNYTHLDGGGDGTSADPYTCADNEDADTKEERTAPGSPYVYGTGVATIEIAGGKIHYVYGGSNEKGNIRTTAVSTYEELDEECPIVTDETYGGGKNSIIDGVIDMGLGCIQNMAETFGGSKNADVNSDIVLNITNGTYGRVFGGNNTSGNINGSITVNIYEDGCSPVRIGELYTGGYLAGYSIYGYKEVDGKKVPRTKADWEALTDQEKDAEGLTTPRQDPRINVISATRIDNIFGGGYKAVVVGNPHVNVNMENGRIKGGKGYFVHTAESSFVGVHHDSERPYYDYEVLRVEETTDETTGVTTYGDAILAIGTIGTIYGGGNEADIIGDTYVEIGTGTYYNNGTYETISPARKAATITGNVFGGGKGVADSFKCLAAMIGVENQDFGSTNITIANGTVKGSVYGGGEIGRVEKNTTVTIGIENDTENNPVVEGNVFGAGKGLNTHGYSALVRGNSSVTVQGKAKVKGSVYGGGEIASVGKYTLNASGMPVSLANQNSGYCTVTIRDDAEIGPDEHMKMVTSSGYPDDAGHVFGAGMGVLPYEGVEGGINGEPWRMQPGDTEQWFVGEGSSHEYVPGKNDDSDYKKAYLKYIETLGLATQTYVTISENAFIKGSVYGGSMNGHVQHDTNVTIEGGQIGWGKNAEGRHPDTVWGESYTVSDGTDLECESWPFTGNHLPFDIYDVDSDGKPKPASDGHTFYGNVFGGGSGYYPYAQNPEWSYNETKSSEVGSRVDANGYADGLWHSEAGSVGGNTVVNITGGHILTSVYGGNEQTNVVGSCTINMTGGTVGVPRTVNQMKSHPVTCYVFGAGKGDQRINFNTWTNVASTGVNISGNARIYGSTFGGGEDGHVIGDVVTNIGGTVTIGSTSTSHSDVIIGTTGTSSVDGNIFGGGRGFSETALAAGAVGGNVTVNIQNGKMLGSIFGGGRLASVGTYFADVESSNYGKMQDDSESETHGHIAINISGGTIGATDSSGKLMESASSIGDVFGGCKGSATNDQFGLAKKTSISVTGGTVNGSVYGGGEAGNVTQDVDVAIAGGSIGGDVYGGGALANTNIANWDGTNNKWAAGNYDATTYATAYNTDVVLTSGVINGNVYGGGLGRQAKKAVAAQDAVAAQGTEGEPGYVPAQPAVEAQPAVAAVEAKVYGDVLVKLNGTVRTETTGEGESATTTTTYPDNCVVKGSIFGCNNQNGSPQSAVTVHIYKTQGWDGHTGTASGDLANEDATHTYHLAAVYGGGNLSAFKPDLESVRDTVQTHVIIDGCDMTSIQQVYGGGNAASTPATNIIVNGTYEIEEVFGGGNGKDAITVNGVTQTNPGANVGYVAYSTEYDPPASSKEERTSKFAYGTGKASVTILGGRIHRVFGGSNTKGNVRESAVTMLQDMEGCYFVIDEAYGGGKSAPMDADAQLLMACIPGLKAAYGGAEDADIAGGVTLTITNGTFDRVFGGNNKSGSISGPIVVNIEEMGCRPIIIGELYGGGNQAGYSVYGYDNRIPRESGTNPLWADPVVNVKSFTSIGDIYGGGYGETAVMVASPTVNINVAEGRWADDDQSVYSGEMKTIDGHRVTLPPHEKGEGKIGVIQNVYGGGNAAKVIGTPNVNIGTRLGEDEYMAVIVEEGKTLADCYTFTKASGTAVAGTTYYQKDDGGAYRQVTVGEGASVEDYYIREESSGTPVAGTTYYKKYTVKGADIRGNVYGGGNAAEVTGNTNVVIGKETATP